MTSFSELLSLFDSEGWKYSHIYEKRAVSCRGVTYYFKNDMLKTVETPHILLRSVTNIEIVNGAVHLFDDFNEEIGYVKSMCQM